MDPSLDKYMIEDFGWYLTVCVKRKVSLSSLAIIPKLELLCMDTIKRSYFKLPSLCTLSHV